MVLIITDTERVPKCSCRQKTLRIDLPRVGGGHLAPSPPLFKAKMENISHLLWAQSWESPLLLLLWGKRGQSVWGWKSHLPRTTSIRTSNPSLTCLPPSHRARLALSSIPNYSFYICLYCNKNVWGCERLQNKTIKIILFSKGNIWVRRKIITIVIFKNLYVNMENCIVQFYWREEKKIILRTKLDKLKLG